MSHEIHLYNCKSTPEPGAWIITKFDQDLNVMSTYLTTSRDCACPRGDKHCRHKTMLSHFKRQGHIDDGWFLKWADGGPNGWHEPIPVTMDLPDGVAVMSVDEFIDAVTVSIAPAPAAAPAVPVLPPAEQVAGAPTGIKRRKLGHG